MKILATFGIYDGDPTAIDFITAIGEYRWEVMDDGEIDALTNQVLNDWFGGDIPKTDTRTVWIDVNDAAISAMFARYTITGTVSKVEE